MNKLLNSVYTVASQRGGAGNLNHLIYLFLIIEIDTFVMHLYIHTHTQTRTHTYIERALH